MKKPGWRGNLLKAKRLWKRYPGLVGIDYGYATKKGELLKKLAIRFHVRTKRGLTDIPSSEVLPRSIDGMRCDVIEGSYSLHASPHDECSPLQPGLSIGNLENGETGTLGMIVTIGGQPGSYILSNWHVLAGSTSAKKGDRICQPGPADVGNHPARVVGQLSKWTDLGSGIDAAIASLDPAYATSEQLFGQSVRISGWEDPAMDMKLAKAGAYSGFTNAIIDGVEGSFEVDYSNYGDQKRWMDAYRLKRDPNSSTQEVSIAGDSGALWVNAATGRAVLLHFGGEDDLGPSADYALAHPIRRVLELLNVQSP